MSWTKRLSYARVHGARQVLLKRAESAREAARATDDPDSYGAAALRGKARGYQEAADILEALERDRWLPKKIREVKRGFDRS